MFNLCKTQSYVIFDQKSARIMLCENARVIYPIPDFFVPRPNDMCSRYGKDEKKLFTLSGTNPFVGKSKSNLPTRHASQIGFGARVLLE